jgi:hypothetical protein
VSKSSVKYGALPFDEAIAFFRQKLNMPTERFDDLTGAMHAKGFMVAGAMKAELLTDLRAAVDKVISQGGTIETFRKDFDNTVAAHGWRYKGGRNWRTKVIYHTNLRQSYNTGRWNQMTDPDVVRLRPYLTYRHSGSADPRESHLALNGLTLPVDDPFWDTHAPQNGWGCNCRLDSASERDLKRMGKKGPDKAPEIEYRTHVDRDGNETRVPVGIDPGFDYNPGKATGRSYNVMAQRMETLPYGIAREFTREAVQGPAFQRFYTGKIKGQFPVAVLTAEQQAAMGASGQVVWLSQEVLAKIKAVRDGLEAIDLTDVQDLVDKGLVKIVVAPDEQGRSITMLSIED